MLKIESEKILINSESTPYCFRVCLQLLLQIPDINEFVFCISVPVILGGTEKFSTQSNFGKWAGLRTFQHLLIHSDMKGNQSVLQTYIHMFNFFHQHIKSQICSFQLNMQGLINAIIFFIFVWSYFPKQNTIFDLKVTVLYKIIINFKPLAITSSKHSSE